MATDWTARVRFPDRLCGPRRQGRKVGHSSPSAAEVKNGGTTPPLPYVFMVKVVPALN
jgi:hypothetical protein